MPDAPRASDRPFVTVLAAIVVGAAATVLGWFRMTELTRGTLWAEDSRVFLQQRVRFGPVDTLFQPYDGYLHLVPRLLADVVTALPIADAALAITAAGCVTVGFVAAAVVVFSAGTVRTWPARVLLALVPVLTPPAAFEVLGDLANVHTFLLFLAPVLLLARPARWRGAVVPAAVALLVALTEVQAIVFVPLLVLLVRRRRAWPIGAAFLVGVAAQVVTTLASPRSRTAVPVHALDVVRGYLLEPVLSILEPDAQRAGPFAVAHGLLPAVLLLAAFGVAIIVALVGRWRPGDGYGRFRALVIAFALASPIVWTAGVVLNPTAAIDFTTNGPGLIATTGYLRYAVAPAMFLLALPVLAGDRILAARSSRPLAVVSGAVVLAAVVALVVPGYPSVGSGRALGPEWARSYRSAIGECASGERLADVQGAPSGWHVEFSCASILRDAFP